MAIKLGYITEPSSRLGSTLAHEPTFHPRRTSRIGSTRTNICPAISEYDSSSFDVCVPYDLSFEVKKQRSGAIEIHINQEKTTVGNKFLNDCFETSLVEEGIIQVNIHPFWVFISDEPNVIVSQLSAYRQTNPEPIRGQFDCYQWFRPMSYAFEFDFNQEIRISRQSPIYQVKFYHPTESNFSLSECILTPDIEKHIQGYSLQNFNQLTRWKKVFEFAGKRRPKSLLRFQDNSQEI